MDSVKKRVYINILIFVSIVSAMFYFGFVYFVEKERNLSLEIISKKKEIEQFKLQSEQIGEIRDAHREWREKTETVLKSIVRRSKLFDYVIEIRNLADENNVELETIISAKDKGRINDNFSYTYYKIRAAGSFNDVMKFLACVENLKYYSEMENISFVTDNEPKTKHYVINQNSEKILFSADLKIYMYHAEAE